MKVYISGPMTGLPNQNREEFHKAKIDLLKKGHDVFDPTVMPNFFTWEQILPIDVAVLELCDAIYMLKGWENSRGAALEKREAERWGKIILFQELEEKEKQDA